MATQDLDDRVNVGRLERLLSILGGGSLLIYAFRRGSFRSLLAAFLGAEFVYRGAKGHCVLYDLLDVSTAETEEIIKEKVQELRAKPADKEQRPPEKAASETGASLQPQVKTAAKKSGSPKYEEMSKEELYEKAKELDIAGRSKMGKEALIKALRAKS